MEPKQLMRSLEQKKLLQFKSYNKKSKSKISMLMDAVLELSTSIVQNKIKRFLKRQMLWTISIKVEEYQDNNILKYLTTV